MYGRVAGFGAAFAAAGVVYEGGGEHEPEFDQTDGEADVEFDGDAGADAEGDAEFEFDYPREQEQEQDQNHDQWVSSSESTICAGTPLAPGGPAAGPPMAR